MPDGDVPEGPDEIIFVLVESDRLELIPGSVVLPITSPVRIGKLL